MAGEIPVRITCYDFNKPEVNDSTHFVHFRFISLILGDQEQPSGYSGKLTLTCQFSHTYTKYTHHYLFKKWQTSESGCFSLSSEGKKVLHHHEIMEFL